jgi:hypothetical protein
MILKKLYSVGDNTITFEYVDDEELPDYGTVVYPEGADDNGVRVGDVLFDKYNVIIYEILEEDIEGSYDDFD